MRIQTIKGNGGSVSFRNRNAGYVMANASGIDALVRNRNIDSTASMSTDVDVVMSTMAGNMDSEPYRVISGRIEILGTEHRISVEKLKWVPLAGHEAFVMIHRLHNRVSF